MHYRDVQLLTNRSEPSYRCSVRANTLLSDIVQMMDVLPHACLLVEDEQGNPVGVVDMEQLRRKITHANPLDRVRWLDMTVESALAGRIELPASSSMPPFVERDPASLRFTAVSQQGRLIALATDDDVLVSWRTVEGTLRKAMDDSVTALPNRTAFDICLQAEFARAQRFGHSLAIILADVDRFKSINDRFGHAAGDAVLGAVGRALRKPLRSYDMVARYGGDEFAIICSGCRPGEIDVTIQRLRSSALDLQGDLSIPQAAPTLSMGICVAHNPEQLSSADAIVEVADECLYQAKNAGRNCSVCQELGVNEPTETNTLVEESRC